MKPPLTLTEGEKQLWVTAFVGRLQTIGYDPEKSSSERASRIKYAAEYAHKLLLDSRYLRGFFKDDEENYYKIKEVLG